jgi:hypothetical protein
MKDVNVAARQAADELRPILERLQEHEAIMEYKKLQRARRTSENEKRYGRNRALWPARARVEDAAVGDGDGSGPHTNKGAELEIGLLRAAEKLLLWAERDDWTDDSLARMLAQPRLLRTAEDRAQAAEDLVCAVAREWLGIDPMGFFTADQTAKKRARKTPAPKKISAEMID